MRKTQGSSEERACSIQWCCIRCWADHWLWYFHHSSDNPRPHPLWISLTGNVGGGWTSLAVWCSLLLWKHNRARAVYSLGEFTIHYLPFTIMRTDIDMESQWGSWGSHQWPLVCPCIWLYWSIGVELQVRYTPHPLCVCERERVCPVHAFPTCCSFLSVSAYAFVYVCVCVCVCWQCMNLLYTKRKESVTFGCTTNVRGFVLAN